MIVNNEKGWLKELNVGDAFRIYSVEMGQEVIFSIVGVKLTIGYPDESEQSVTVLLDVKKYFCESGDYYVQAMTLQEVVEIHNEYFSLNEEG
jgi:hypothetical protein